MHVAVVSEVLNKCAWTAKQYERLVMADERIQELLKRRRFTRAEHFFDQGPVFASAEFVTCGR